MTARQLVAALWSALLDQVAADIAHTTQYPNHREI